MDSHGDDRRARTNRGDEGVAAARRASVMTDLEDVGVKTVGGVCEQPILLRFFRVADKEESHRAVAHQGDRAGEVGIVKRNRPRRIRCEELDAHAIDLQVVARVYAMPRDVLRLRCLE